MRRSRIINLLIKGIFITFLLFALYRQVSSQESLGTFWSAFRTNLSGHRLNGLLAAIALMPLNWFLETLKWHVLIRKQPGLRLPAAFKAVLGGVAVSVFTPYRIGEYAGRVLLVKPEYNWSAVIATVIGSMIQLAVLLMAGTIGLICYARLAGNWSLSELWPALLLSGAGGFVLLLIFFNVKRAVSLMRPVRRWEFTRQFICALQMVENYRAGTLIMAMGWALLRYATFCSQYILLLIFFGIEISFQAAAAGSATIFLVQAGIPLSPALGLLARGELALIIWSPFSTNTIEILATTFSLFIINLAVPALVGMVFIFKTNLLKSLSYEEKDQ